MIRAILFDIEGTLTNLDTAKFVQNYLGILAPRFAHLLSPDKFSKQLLKSLETIQKEPKPEQTVIQAFFEDFSKATGQSVQVLKPIFEEFYISDFPALRCLVQANPLWVKVVEFAIQQGFLTAIVSNPLMPLIAIQEEIRWSGLTPEHFKVIATLDNVHFSKPHLGFFQEVAENLGVRPQNCLMITPHINDMVCRELGMKTFLVGSRDTEIQTDYAGQLDDLFQLISQGSL
ncbi:HAD family hydrolase [Desulfosporosinus sp.]|uniref:HAD family hydrolase n=1 Tax=Desulfosporosinus sp. TaxID=157907 RepID=UPI000E9E9679|nr:HAD family hydrolase [Desulfosporosinus sp.]MBC2724420.1 HAD family hydrolase [Desulfosporosinus sp.]MBC2727663.1 HAD family hydrolase [Desulfosporosinus sp.]HBV88007.1 HAD family hydrolase [Desulfosporosinus sp.]